MYNYDNLSKNSKEAWTKLAANLNSAVYHVTGEATEEELIKSGKQDCERIATLTKIQKNEVVLEIGCGVGRIGLPMASKCAAWVGCDISPLMLHFAKRRRMSVSNKQFVELNDTNLSQIRDNSIDVIYCSVVFMHLEEWDRFNYILGSYNSLKKGGRIYVDNFSISTPSGWKTFNDLRKIPQDKRPTHISRSSTKEELMNYFEKAGFNDFEVNLQDQWLIGVAQK